MKVSLELTIVPYTPFAPNRNRVICKTVNVETGNMICLATLGHCIDQAHLVGDEIVNAQEILVWLQHQSTLDNLTLNS